MNDSLKRARERYESVPVPEELAFTVAAALRELSLIHILC